MLTENFQNNVRTVFIEKNKTLHINTIPKIEKIVVNCSLNEKLLLKVITAFNLLTGQSPVVSKTSTRYNYSIFTVQVTLRKEKMYDFISVLSNIYYPSINNLQPKELKKGKVIIFTIDPYLLPQIQMINHQFETTTFPKFNIEVHTNNTNKLFNKKLVTTFKLPMKT